MRHFLWGRPSVSSERSRANARVYMRAASLVGPGHVVVGEHPVPVPRSGEVLVRMSLASICGSDVHRVFHGLHEAAELGQPGYPGHEGVGVVVETRSDRTAVGDRVLLLPGGGKGRCFAEYAAIDARQLIVLPEGADSHRLLLAQQLGTVIYALRRFWEGSFGSDAAVAVIGAGSAGLFFLQLLKARGVGPIVVSDRVRDRLELAELLGADAVALAPEESVSRLAHDITGGRGADLVVEAAGFDDCRAQAVQAARVGGRVGCFGFPEAPGDAPFPVAGAFRKRLRIDFVSGTQSEPGLRSFHEALELVRQRRIRIDYCIAPPVALEELPLALEMARDWTAPWVKTSVCCEPSAPA